MAKPPFVAQRPSFFDELPLSTASPPSGTPTGAAGSSTCSVADELIYECLLAYEPRLTITSIRSSLPEPFRALTGRVHRSTARPTTEPAAPSAGSSGLR